MRRALVIAHRESFLHFEENDIRLLQELGYEVHIAANPANVINLLEMKGICKHEVPFERSPYRKENIVAYRELCRLMEEYSFQLIHCHTPVGGVLGRMAGHKYNVTTVYTAHGFHFFKGAPLKNWLLYYPVEKFCSYMTDVLITINKEDYALAQKKMYAKSVVYIPGVGVDLNKFSVGISSREQKREELGIPKDAFLLLSVGELSARKNHQIVIKALAELKKEDIYYCIAGTGNAREQYQSLIQEGNMEKNILLLVNRTDISELCAASDCFVHPSVREGLGIAPLEGMACGLPLISSCVNGIKDYTEDGVSGCCVKPLDQEAMKSAIFKMYSDENFRKKCGENNLKTVQNFSIEKSAEIMRKLYENIGGGRIKNLTNMLQRKMIRKEMGCSEKDILLLSVGELSKRKNHQIVIKALAELKKEDIYYCIAGQGAEEEHLKELIVKNNLQKNVKLLGFRSDISELLKAADFFILPSLQEGLSVALMEAMASGLPVVCSQIRGNVDLIDERGGRCFDPYSTEDCREAIESLLEKDLKEFGNHNAERIKEFGIENVGKEMRRIYEMLRF